MDIAGLISDEEVRQFQEDGAICLRQVFDQRWVDEVTTGVERNIAEPSDYAGTLKADEDDQGGFFDDYYNWRRIPEYAAFVHEAPVAPMVARLMQSETAAFYHEHLLVKWPGTFKRTPWHHDQPYYPVDGHQTCSIWMPVDPMAQSACVQFVRGSHNWGRWFVPRKFASESNYTLDEPGSTPMMKEIRFEDVPPIDEHPEQYDILSWDMEPGDVIAFHMLALHGAAGNHSLTHARRVLVTRWLGDDTRFATRPWEISPTVTGGLKPGDPMACDEFPLIWPGS